MASTKELSPQKFQERLAQCRAFVVYSPLRTEVDNRDLVTLPLDAVIYRIDPRPSLNPSEEALHALTTIGNMPAAVFVPGRRFDARGTRHGQGGGWYDRFLARVPSEWLRIGFCFETQFSNEPLKQEAWDQPMDYVYVLGGATHVYETNARSATL